MPRGLQRGCLRPSGSFSTAAILAVLVAGLTAGGCGYHVVGRANTLPTGAHTIAVPAFANRTTTYRIEQILTEAVVHEFIARTNYRVVPDANGADLLLHGEVTNLTAGAVLFDPTTGAATTVEVTVTIRVTLADRAGKILFQNNGFVFRQPYEISEEIPSFFQEEGPALERMSRDFAAQLVSDILENF
jgi:hypothetical protein